MHRSHKRNIIETKEKWFPLKSYKPLTSNKLQHNDCVFMYEGKEPN